MNEILTFLIIGDESEKFDGDIFKVYSDREVQLHHVALVKTAEYYRRQFNYEITNEYNYNNMIASKNISDRGHIVYMNLCEEMGILYLPEELTLKQLKTLKENIDLITNDLIYLVNDEYTELDEQTIDKYDIKKITRTY